MEEENDLVPSMDPEDEFLRRFNESLDAGESDPAYQEMIKSLDGGGSEQPQTYTSTGAEASSEPPEDEPTDFGLIDDALGDGWGTGFRNHTLKAVGRGATKAWNGIIRFATRGAMTVTGTTGAYKWGRDEAEQDLFLAGYRADFKDINPWFNLAGKRIPMTFSEEFRDETFGKQQGVVGPILEELGAFGAQMFLGGGIVRGLGRIIPGGARAAQTLGSSVWMQGAASSAVATAAFVDPYEERVSTLIENAPTPLATALSEIINADDETFNGLVRALAPADAALKTGAGWIAPDEKDSRFAANFKAVLEDYFIGNIFTLGGVLLGASAKRIKNALASGKITQAEADALTKEAYENYGHLIEAGKKAEENNFVHVQRREDGTAEIWVEHPDGIKYEEVSDLATVDTRASQLQADAQRAFDDAANPPAQPNVGVESPHKLTEDPRVPLEGDMPEAAAAAPKAAEVPKLSPEAEARGLGITPAQLRRYKAAQKRVEKARAAGQEEKALAGEARASDLLTEVQRTSRAKKVPRGSKRERAEALGIDPSDLPKVEKARNRYWKALDEGGDTVAAREVGAEYNKALEEARGRFQEANGTAPGPTQQEVPTAAQEPTQAPTRGEPTGLVFDTEFEARAHAGIINKVADDVRQASAPLEPDAVASIRREYHEMIENGTATEQSFADLLTKYGVNKKYLGNTDDSIAFIRAMVDEMPDPSKIRARRPTTWAETLDRVKKLFPKLDSQKVLGALQRLGVATEDAPAVLTAARGYFVAQQRELHKLSRLIDLHPNNPALMEAFERGTRNLLDIHAEFSGLKADVGRSLNILRMHGEDIVKAAGRGFDIHADAPKAPTAVAESANMTVAEKIGRKARQAVDKLNTRMTPEEADLAYHRARVQEAMERGDLVVHGDGTFEIGRRMSREEVVNIARMITMAGEDADIEGMLKLLTAPSNRELLAAPKNLRPSMVDSILSTRVSFLLSSFGTHFAQIASGIARMFSDPAEMLWYGISRADKDAWDRGWDLFIGQGLAAQDSIVMAYKAFKNGHAILDLPAGTVEHTLSMPKLNDAFDSFGNAVRTVLHMSTRGMQAEDEFFKQLRYRARTRADILRQIRETQQRTGEVLNATEIRETVRRRMDVAFDSQGRGTYQPGIQDAREATFTQELSGTGKLAQSLINSNPITKFFVPFVRTPVNIFDYIWQLTPGLNAFNKNMQQAIARGGDAAKQATARAELGAALYAVGGLMAASGTVTGQGPKNHDLRRTKENFGWRPHTLKIGDRTYDIRRSDPWLTPFKIMADFWEISGEMDPNEKESFAAAMSAAFAANAFSTTFLSNVSDLLEAAGSSDPAKFERVLKAAAGSFVPSIVNATNPDDHFREVQSILDAVKARIPGLSDTLDPRRNVWGAPVLKPPGWFNRASGFTFSEPPKDPYVGEELMKLGHGLGELPLTMENGMIDLMDKEYFGRDYIDPETGEVTKGSGVSPRERWGQILYELGRDQGSSLEHVLTKLIKSDAWAKIPGDDAYGEGGQKWLLVSQQVQRYRDIAWRKLLAENPRLMKAVNEERSIEARGSAGRDAALFREKQLRDAGGLIHRQRR